MNKKKLVLINYNLFPGGTERYISELSNYLDQEGYKVTLILLRKDKKFYSLNNSINLIEPNLEYEYTLLGKYIYYIRLISYLRKNISKIKPSLVLNAAFPTIMITAFYGLNIPIILSIRCDPENIKLIEGLFIPLFIRRLLYRKYNAIIAQTQYSATVLRSQFKKNHIITIPNFLSKVRIPQIQRENIIISAGRLKRSKGFDILIRIFKKIDSNGWRLLILGDGPEKESITNLIKSLDLEDQVKLIEYQKNISSYLAKSKIFAFTSLTEGFPNVLLEAMATPLACICFDINPGIKEIINNGENGFLIESENINDYSAKLQLLVSDDLLREEFMKKAIKVREIFSWESVKSDYIELIEKF